MASDWEIQQLTRAVDTLTGALRQFTEQLRDLAEPLDVIATHIEEQRAKPTIPVPGSTSAETQNGDCRLTDSREVVQ